MCSHITNSILRGKCIGPYLIFIHIDHEGIFSRRINFRASINSRLHALGTNIVLVLVKVCQRYLNLSVHRTFTQHMEQSQCAQSELHLYACGMKRCCDCCVVEYDAECWAQTRTSAAQPRVFFHHVLCVFRTSYDSIPARLVLTMIRY